MRRWTVWYITVNIHLRYGPFDIHGGGGAWDLCLGRKIFFRQYRRKVIFFAGPSGRIIFFITEIYKYRGFRDNFMLIMVFATTICLIQAFTTNSGLIQAFQTQFRFSGQLHTARGSTWQLHSQLSHITLNTLFRFSSQLHTRIDLKSLCEHHSQIIKSCLVMIIGHSNCEKGYKVYNISNMTISNGAPVWK